MTSATIKLPAGGGGRCLVTIRTRQGEFQFTFDSIEEACDFCVCCDFTWSLSVAPLELKPPRGKA